MEIISIIAIIMSLVVSIFYLIEDDMQSAIYFVLVAMLNVMMIS